MGLFSHVHCLATVPGRISPGCYESSRVGNSKQTESTAIARNCCSGDLLLDLFDSCAVVLYLTTVSQLSVDEFKLTEAIYGSLSDGLNIGLKAVLCSDMSVARALSTQTSQHVCRLPACRLHLIEP